MQAGLETPSRISACGSLASNIQSGQGACDGTQITQHTAYKHVLVGFEINLGASLLLSSLADSAVRSISVDCGEVGQRS